MLSPKNNFSTSDLTLFAICAGALLYFSALIPDVANYLFNSTTNSASNTATNDGSHTTLALGLLAMLLFGMAYLYEKGHKFAVNFAIIAMALSTPYVFEPHAFQNSSIPQGIWLPFIFAMAVAQFRDAIITLCISITLAFFSYPGAFRTPRTICETLLIFFLLMLGRLVLHRLVANVINEQNRVRALQLEMRDNKTAGDLIAASIVAGYECGQLIYHEGVAVDFIYLRVNDAYEKIAGIRNIVGQKMSDIVNDESALNERLAVYARVAATGVPEQMKVHSKNTDTWYRLSVCSSKAEHCIGVFHAMEVVSTPQQFSGITTRDDMSDYNISESELNSILEESGDAIWMCDSDDHFIYTNPTASKLTGFSTAEFAHLRLSELVHEEREDELLEYLVLTKYAKFARHEWMLNHKDGSRVHVEITTGHLASGRFIMVGRDMTGKMKTESERFKFFQAIEASPGSIMMTNLEGDIEYVNAAFLKRTGYNRKEVIGKNPRLLKSSRTPPQLFIDLWKTIKRGEIWQGEMFSVSKNGQEYVQFTTITPIRQPDGTISHFIANSEDITERKRGEDKIFELAYFDPLTGLPNRLLLLDRLKQVISISLRNNTFNALLFIDLDNFKNINDTLGHQQGDQILQQVAQSLMLRVREGDTVSRFGGDEFIVLLAGLGTESDVAAERAKTSANKLLHALNQTFQLSEVAHHNTASIGVAMFNGKNCSTDELLKQADMAMYKAKKAGKNTMRFFDPSLEFAMKHRASMEKDLRVALQNEQFFLHFQGQFTDESQLTGAEVLLRWQHPEQGLISPGVFIPFAEETGLIVPIGNWVLESACTQLALWKNTPDRSDLVLAVNVSALQFRQADFIETVLNILKKTGANPHRLKLELTESMLIENVDDIIHKMLELKNHGVGFSLDDFGTGYSSLSFLKRLPLNQIKIDQSFIRDIHQDPNGASIAKTIVSLGQNLGLNVIAEGVETLEQREFLSNAGCYAYQGYLFSRPISIEEFEVLASKSMTQIVVSENGN